MGSIPRSWFAAAAAVFFSLALLIALSHPTVRDKGFAGAVATSTCQSPWEYIRSTPSQETVSLPWQCDTATTTRKNLATGLLLLGGVSVLTLAASFARRTQKPITAAVRQPSSGWPLHR